MSVKAKRVFRFCAWWTLLASIVIGILLLFPAVFDNSGAQSLPGLLISVFFGIVGMIGSVASLVLIVGMFAHLLKVSEFSASSKAIWAIIFILFPLIGQVIYFFTVYVRNRAVLEQAV
jgi:hypothetical protein